MARLFSVVAVFLLANGVTYRSIVQSIPKAGKSLYHPGVRFASIHFQWIPYVARLNYLKIYKWSYGRYLNW